MYVICALQGQTDVHSVMYFFADTGRPLTTHGNSHCFQLQVNVCGHVVIVQVGYINSARGLVGGRVNRISTSTSVSNLYVPMEILSCAHLQTHSPIRT